MDAAQPCHPFAEWDCPKTQHTTRIPRGRCSGLVAGIKLAATVGLSSKSCTCCVCVQASVSLVTAITARIARKRSRDPGYSANTSILLLPAAAESYSVFRHQRSGPIIGWDPVPTEGNHSAYYVSNNSH